jgi:hypothetical protein
VRRALAPSLLVVLAACATAAPAATAAPRVTATPNPIPFGEKQAVNGRGWPVIEFCSRTVRLSLRSDQNAFRIGTDRVTTRGRFRFTWIPRRRDVGRGDWTLVARMRCESGKDGSPNPVRATTPIRIGGSKLVVERGRTSLARWTLYTRRTRRGLSTGVQTRPLDEQRSCASGEGCRREARRGPLDFGVFFASGAGTFAYGTAGLAVARVEVTFGKGAPRAARLLPSPAVLGFRGRFWIAPFDGESTVVSARAFDATGKLLRRIENPAAPPPKPGQPAPQATADCPKRP